MEKRKHKEMLERKLALETDKTTSVASATEMTGLFSAMPPAQSWADMLGDIVGTPVPIVPEMGDGKIAGKRVQKR